MREQTLRIAARGALVALAAGALWSAGMVSAQDLDRKSVV